MGFKGDLMRFTKGQLQKYQVGILKFTTRWDFQGESGLTRENWAFMRINQPICGITTGIHWLFGGQPGGYTKFRGTMRGKRLHAAIQWFI